MAKTIFKEGNDVVGEIDWKLDNLRKAASAMIFLLLLHTVLLGIILSLVFFGVLLWKSTD